MDLQTFSVLLPAVRKERRGEMRVFHWAVEMRHYQVEGIIVMHHETRLVIIQQDHSSCVGKRRSDLSLTFSVRRKLFDNLPHVAARGAAFLLFRNLVFRFVTKTSFVWLNGVTTSLFVMLQVNVDRLTNRGGKKSQTRLMQFFTLFQYYLL